MLTLFPDSNLFLQCKELRQLDWSVVANGTDQVELLVARTVQEEIDRLKGDGSGRRSKRARTASALFRKMIQSDEQRLAIRVGSPSVEIGFAPVAVGQHEGLDLSRADDRLVGEVLAYSRQSSDHPVALLTHDTGPMLTAKQSGCEYVAIPDEWLLLPEPNLHDKKIAKLEAEIDQLKQQSPIISLAVLEGSKSCAKLEIDVQRHDPIQCSELMEELTRQHPMKEDFAVVDEAKEASGYEYEPPKGTDVQNYQNVLYPRWVGRVEELLADMPVRFGEMARHREVVVDVGNIGTVPASNVVWEISVSPGFSLAPPDAEDRYVGWDGQDVSLPKPPNAPEGKWKLRDSSGLLDVLSAMGSSSRMSLLDTHRITPNHILNARYLNSPEKDRYTFFWRPKRPHAYSGSHEFECVELRHQVEPERFKLCVYVNPEDDPSGGILQCRLTAANLAKPAVIRVPIGVAYERATAQAIAESLVRSI